MRAPHSDHNGMTIYHDPTKKRRPWSVKILAHNRYAQVRTYEDAKQTIDQQVQAIRAACVNRPD